MENPYDQRQRYLCLVHQTAGNVDQDKLNRIVEVARALDNSVKHAEEYRPPSKYKTKKNAKELGKLLRRWMADANYFYKELL